jgi:hypothetical protein
MINLKWHQSGVSNSSVGILIKNDVFPFIDILDSEDSCIHVLWIKVHKEVFGQAFLLGSVYVPNEGSVHHNHHWSDDLANNVSALSARYDLPVVLVGDFNARTGRLDDFALVDEVVANECGFIPDSDLLIDTKEDLVSLGVEPNRCNRDGQVNNNGRSLIELCQAFNLKVVNGRFGSDIGVGEFTYETARGKSTIDYIIMSSGMLPLVTEFEVDVFDPCLSDAHRPLCLTLYYSDSADCSGLQLVHGARKGSVDTGSPDASISDCIKVTWQPSQKEAYKAAFSSNDMETFSNLLNTVEECINTDALVDIRQDQMESISCLANRILLDPARGLGMARNISQKPFSQRKKVYHKPWFDEECRTQKKNYLSWKRKAKHNKSPEVIQQLQVLSKQYKKFIRNASRRYYKTVQESLREIKTSDPKEYWRLINNVSGAQNADIAVSIETLYQHFSEMNAMPSDSIAVNNAPSSANEGHVDVNDRQAAEPDSLNDSFTVTEVQEGVSCLKVNKEAGIDGVINELLKNCPPMMLSLITKWFNLILESGIVPES